VITWYSAETGMNPDTVPGTAVFTVAVQTFSFIRYFMPPPPWYLRLNEIGVAFSDGGTKPSRKTTVV
jgi:hypothetical protein